MKKTILISEELYNQITDIATDYTQPTEEMAESLLNSQVTKYLQEKATMFYPGTKYKIDPTSFVQARMLKSDLLRLNNWIAAKNELEFIGGSKLEVIIFNKSIQKALKERLIKKAET